MKQCLIALTLATASLAAMANPDVGVSVHVNQPGVYGRIDIGNVPSPPVLVYQQPVIIAQPRVVVQQQPMYLHVPPGHAKNWRKHCRKYQACGQPVYFVREDWYEQQYVPHHQARVSNDAHRGDGKRGGDRHDHDRGGKHDKHEKHDKHGGHGKGGKHKD